MISRHYIGCKLISCTANLTILLATVLVSCIEPFDLSVKQQADILSINGRITNGSEPQYVFVGSSSSENRIARPVSGATVTLHDGFGNSWQYFDETPGTYVLPAGAITTLPGYSYSIEVELPNGQMYKSVPETMPSLLAKDSIYYRFNVLNELNDNGINISQNVFEVYIDSEIPEDSKPLYLKWEIQEAWELKPTDFPDGFGVIPPPCFYSSYPDPQRINLYSSLEERSGSFTGRLMARTEVGLPFITRYASIVSQYALTKETYDYWKNVRSNIDQTGSIFDIPPALIPGNISNSEDPNELVFGYFSVSMVKESRVIVRLDDVPFFVVDQCLFDPMKFRNDYPSICLQCEVFTQDLILRPSYFP